MMEKHKILIIEDDEKLNKVLSTILETDDYEAFSALNGSDGISFVAKDFPDLVILDLGLPDIDGMDVLTRIREWTDIPVIILSARQDETEKVKALDLGANDYITKPFGNNELLARIRNAIRIYDRINEPQTDTYFETGGLHIDYEKRLVTVDGAKVHLTPVEYKIVHLLSKNAGKVMTHDQITEHVWGPFPDSQLLRVNVANIRRKIEKNPADPKYITTEVRVGYRMQAE